MFPLLALELIIAAFEVVKVLFKLPARRTFREVAEATALAKRIMAAARGVRGQVIVQHACAAAAA